MLYLECKPDEALAVSLGVPKRRIIHTDDKGRVCKFLMEKKNVIGMVDEDPLSPQPTYLRQLPDVEKVHEIKLLHDAPRSNQLIIICPRFEDWLIATAKASKVDLNIFRLSDSSRALHSEINQRISNLQNLIRDLLDRKNQRMLHLQSLLKPVSC